MNISARRQDLLDALVEEGVLSPEAAASAAARAHGEWLPLGRVLRDAGKLTMAQVLELIETQALEPGTRFGELAVRAGLCMQADVDAARVRQRTGSRHPLEVLLDERRVDAERVCRALIRYLERVTAV